jgi:hypothetical protein
MGASNRIAGQVRIFETKRIDTQVVRQRSSPMLGASARAIAALLRRLLDLETLKADRLGSKMPVPIALGNRE